MKLQCLIVDDEPLARKGLREYIAQVDFLELVQECKNAVQANDALKLQHIDILFLDIQMPLLTGLEFLRSLPVSPQVVFTTAYPDYALEGYAFDVIDYLVKPISFERFLQAANKAHRHCEKMQRAPDVKTEEYIFVKSERLLRKVRIRDIRYIEAMQNYVLIHTATDRITVHSTIKQIAATLPPGDFIQIHKSYIISSPHVEAIDGNQVVIGAQRVPISTRMKKEVLDMLLKGG